MIYLPVLGALALGVSAILERTILKKRKIHLIPYTILAFLAVVVVSLPFLYFFWEVDFANALTSQNIFILGIVIFFSIFANIFSFYSLKGDKISNLEPARVLDPLFTILLALGFSFIFGQELYERNLGILIPALIAACALIIPHIKKNHLYFNKYFLAAIAGSFFFAAELVVSRLILDYYSPIAFYFIRCLLVLLAMCPLLFKYKLDNVDKKVTGIILVTGLFWFAYRVVVYYGYLHLGLVFTTLLTMLAPLVTYTFAWLVLKEKVNWRNVLSAAIIVGCVLYATLG